MSTGGNHLLLFFLLSFTILRSSSSSPVHDLLIKYGLPKGLIPDVVKSFSLSEKDGSFQIELANACYVQFDDLVYYEKKITGRISYGQISDLSGIQAKKFFFWVSVTGMKLSSSDYIEFDAGALSEKLPIAQFDSIPTCRSRGCRKEGPAIAEA